jgi:ParB/RepB/Spo0J family partition protein
MATKNRKTPAAPATTTPAPQLQFVELAHIRAAAQVRTEFNDEDLAELAASIQQQGILQPVLLRPDPDAIGSYVIIAGERRVRAAHLAGLTAVPALIGEVDQAKAAEMQLVENIQREELSITEMAAAIAQLYEKHKGLKPIAELTGKSISWVSKHLALGRGLGWRANMLLASGKSEDLELVLTVSQIEKLAWGRPQQLLLEKIEQGTAGREEARATLAEIKDQVAAEKKKDKAKKAKASKSNQPAPWTAHDGMGKLGELVNTRDTFDIDAVLSNWTAEQQDAMCALVRSSWDAGTLSSSADKLLSMRRMAQHRQVRYGDEEDDAAYILGANGIELSLRDLAIEWRAIAE